MGLKYDVVELDLPSSDIVPPPFSGEKAIDHFILQRRRAAKVPCGGTFEGDTFHRSESFASMHFTPILAEGSQRLLQVLLSMLDTAGSTSEFDPKCLDYACRGYIEKINMEVSRAPGALRFQIQNSDGISSAFYDDSGDVSKVHRSRGSTGKHCNYFNAIKSVETYGRTLAKLVVFLLHTADLAVDDLGLGEQDSGLLFRLLATIHGNSPLMTALASLRVALTTVGTNGDGNIVVTSVGDVIHSLIAPKYDISDGFSVTPFHTFLFCCGLSQHKSSGSVVMRAASRLTGIIAMLLFAIKGSCMMKILANPHRSGDIFQCLVSRNMTYQTPFGMLLSLFRLAKASESAEDNPHCTVEFGTNSDGRVDFNSFHIGGVCIRTPQFRASAVKLIQEDLADAMKKVLCDFTVPLDLFENIRDDLQSVEPMYGFVHDPRNVELHEVSVAYEKYILGMLCEPIHNPSAIDQEVIIRLRDIPLTSSFLENIDKLGDLLRLAIHVLGGQCPRATEISCLTTVNRVVDAELIRRSVFFHETYNCFLIMPRHSKGHIQHVPRFITVKKLSIALGTWIALITPVKAAVSSILLGRKISNDGNAEEIFDSCLWSNTTCSEALSASAIRLQFAESFRFHFGSALTFQQYRHLAISLLSVGLRLTSPSEYRVMMKKLISIPCLQSSHSVETALLSYDLSRINFRHVDPLTLAGAFHFSSDWADFILQGEWIDPLRSAGIGAAGNSTGNSYVESMITNLSGLVDRLQRSVADHRSHSKVLSSYTGLVQGRPHNPVVPVYVDNGEYQYANNLLQLVFPDQKFTKWKSDSQQRMILTCLRAIRIVEDWLFVLPTSGGKSLSIMIMILDEQKRAREMKRVPRVTIVVSPIRALVNDLKVKVDSTVCAPDGGIGSCCLALVGGGLSELPALNNDDLHVIITTPEAFNTASFKLYIDNLDRIQRLGAVIFDESHCLVSDSFFRPQMKEACLYARRLSQVPLIFLSATFPPALEGYFRREFGLGGLNIDRTTNDRKDLHYLRVDIRDGKTVQSAEVAYTLFASIFVLVCLDHYVSMIHDYNSITYLASINFLAIFLLSFSNIRFTESTPAVDHRVMQAASKASRWSSTGYRLC